MHSFRRGVGRSTLIANLAALLAIEGKRVGVIDNNLQTPGLHLLFNLNEDDITYSLNDYLSGNCDIQQTIYNIRSHVDPHLAGGLFFIPSSSQADDITRVLRHRYDMELFNAGLQQFAEKLNLDVLLIDPHSGLNEEALCTFAIVDTVIMLIRPDCQDYHGIFVLRYPDYPLTELYRQIADKLIIMGNDKII